MAAPGLRPRKKPSSFNLEAPSSAEDGPHDFTDVELAVTVMHAALVGASSSPSVTWTVRFAPLRNDVGTEVVIGGTTTISLTDDVITVFDNAVIPAGSYIWIETTAQSGVVPSMGVSVVYT